MQEVDYADLGGGRNAGAAPTQIPTRQMVELSNFYPYGSRLRRRGGVRNLTAATWSNAIYGMHPLKKSDGSWVLVLGGGTKFGRLDGNAIVDIPFSGGLSLTEKNTGWT